MTGNPNCCHDHDVVIGHRDRSLRMTGSVNSYRLRLVGEQYSKHHSPTCRLHTYYIEYVKPQQYPQ